MAKKITCRGETKSINEWSRITRIPRGTLRYWLNKGLSLGDILGPPYNDNNDDEQTNEQITSDETLESSPKDTTGNKLVSDPKDKLVDGKPKKTKKPKRASKDDIVEYDGFRKTVEEWAKTLGIHYAILCERLDEHPLEKAFKIPHKIPEHIVEYKGQTKTIKSWALELETTYQSLYNKFKDGSWPPIRNKTPEQLVRQQKTKLAKELKKKEKQKLKRELKKLEVKLKSHQRFEYGGQIKTVRQWAITKGIDYQTLRFRLQKGWGIKKSLEEPVREKNRNNT